MNETRRKRPSRGRNRTAEFDPDPADPDKTPALLHAMGRIIEGLGGRYITADDVGTTLADMIIMREVTRHTAGATAAA